MAQAKRGRPRGRRAAKPKVAEAALTGGNKPVIDEAEQPVPEVRSARDWTRRFDDETVGRIRSCQEVYLVCKNGAQDKTIHRAEWLKEVV